MISSILSLHVDTILQIDSKKRSHWQWNSVTF